MSLFSQLCSRYGAVKMVLAMSSGSTLELKGRFYCISKTGEVIEVKKNDE